MGPLSPRSTPGFDFRRVFPPRDKKCGFGHWGVEEVSLYTDASGSDDHLSSERRGTPHDTTEGLDQEHSTRSDHLLHRHTTLGQSYRVSEPKGGIDVPDKASPPGSVGEEATPAGMLSAELPASFPPTEALTDPKGSGLTVAAIRPAAVNSQRDASIAQQHQSTELGRTSDEALGVREPAQNLGVSPPPSPLLAAAGQPPASVPLPQSGAPGARNYLDIIRSPAPTRPSSPAPVSYTHLTLPTICSV